MRLQDIMSRDVKSLSPDATVEQARTFMQVSGVHHLLVRDEKAREIVGIVSERDLGGPRSRPDRGAESRLVSDIMVKSVVTAEPTTTVREAANLLRGHNIGCLPVLEDGKPVGIITTTDLLELLGRGIDRPADRGERATLPARGPRASGPTPRHARRG